MANYLDYLYQRRGIQPGLLGGSSDSAAQMLQNGAANTQALMQANNRIRAQQAQDEAAAAQGMQKALADEEARKQKILSLGMMFATGGAGGPEAAATPEIANGATAAEIESALAKAAQGAEAGTQAFEAAKAADSIAEATAGPSLLPGIGGGKGASMRFAPTGVESLAKTSWWDQNKDWILPLVGNMALR